MFADNRSSLLRKHHATSGISPTFKVHWADRACRFSGLSVPARVLVLFPAIQRRTARKRFLPPPPPPSERLQVECRYASMKVCSHRTLPSNLCVATRRYGCVPTSAEHVGHGEFRAIGVGNCLAWPLWPPRRHSGPSRSIPEHRLLRNLKMTFDCETNGLLPTLTKLHCLVISDLDTRERFDFVDRPGFEPIHLWPGDARRG